MIKRTIASQWLEFLIMMPAGEDLVQPKTMVVSSMTDLIKKAYITNMSYDVTDTEKMQAERALVFFNHTVKLLDQASDYMDIMKTPFKDNPDMNPDEVIKARAAIRRFRDKAIDNF